MKAVLLSAVYNLASGSNVTNRDIIAEIRAEIPAGLEVAAGSPDILFQPIDTDRIATEFGFRPRPVLSQVRALAAKFRALIGDAY